MFIYTQTTTSLLNFIYFTVIDIATTNLQFASEKEGIIREIPGAYNFTVTLSYVAGTEPVSQLTTAYNYKCSYAYRTAALTDVEEMDSSGERVYISDFTETARGGKYPPAWYRWVGARKT